MQRAVTRSPRKLALLGAACVLSASSIGAGQSELGPSHATKPAATEDQAQASAADTTTASEPLAKDRGGDDSPPKPIEAPPRKITAAVAELDAQRLRLQALGLSQEVVAPVDGSHLGWALLTLPERIIETFLLPIGALVVVIERHRVPQRTVDLLENDAGTIAFRPKVKVSTGQGLGAGASLKLKSKFASQSRLTLSGLFELDSDFDVGLTVSRRIASLEGRKLEIRLAYETERDADFSGTGAGTSNTNRRALGIDEARAEFDLDLSGRGAQEFTGLFSLNFIRQRLYSGTGTSPPVGELDDVVAPPSASAKRPT